MLKRILREIPITSAGESSSTGIVGISTLDGVLRGVAGATLDRGFYRFHTEESAQVANEQSAQLIDGFRGRYRCFAFDWLGRNIAVKVNDAHDDGQVIAVDPGGGEYLKTGVRFSAWHDAVCGAGDPLARTFYQEWRRVNPEVGAIGFDQVVGYNVPLFLGGADDVHNLEVLPREIYFEICTQLARGARKMAPGTVISEVVIRGGSGASE